MRKNWLFCFCCLSAMALGIAGFWGCDDDDSAADGGQRNDVDSGADLTEADFQGMCESATTAAECEAASARMPQPDCADCWRQCSMSAFVETSVEADGGCLLGETIDFCHYESGGEDDPWHVNTLPGCGTTRGEPAYLEREGKRYTALLPWRPQGIDVAACEDMPDGTSSVPECACLCGGRSDPALSCESTTYGTCRDPASGLAWLRDTAPSAEGEAGKIDLACQEVNWGDNIAWRKPTIDDLRTLIRGCPQSAAGGACAVGTACADASCKDTRCAACDAIPYPDRDCYLPKELGWPCTRYWSATRSPEGGTWGIDFTTGEIFLAPPESKTTAVLTCVGEGTNY